MQIYHPNVFLNDIHVLISHIFILSLPPHSNYCHPWKSTKLSSVIGYRVSKMWWLHAYIWYGWQCVQVQCTLSKLSPAKFRITRWINQSETHTWYRVCLGIVRTLCSRSSLVCKVEFFRDSYRNPNSGYTIVAHQLFFAHNLLIKLDLSLSPLTPIDLQYGSTSALPEPSLAS